MQDNIELSISHPLGPLYAPSNIFDIMYWTKDYERRNKFPATLLNRFAIGFYQIHQGMAWKDNGVNKYESIAAAALHFFMVAVRLDLPVEDDMHIKLEEFNRPFALDCEKLLFHLSRAQQHLIYSAKFNKTKRVSRYSPETLSQSLSIVLHLLISYIPTELRVECFEKATTIITKELK